VNGDTKRDLNYATIPYTILVDGDGNIVKVHSGYLEGDELVLADELEKMFGKANKE
jgi:hypothetical protein